MSREMQKYPKIYHFSSKNVNLEDFLDKDIVITEKIDGKNFRILIDLSAMKLHFGSKRVEMGNEKFQYDVFNKAIDIFLETFTTDTFDSLIHILQDQIEEGVASYLLIFGEYLGSNREGILLYERTPRKYVVVFDMVYGYLIFDKETNGLVEKTVVLNQLNHYDIFRLILEFLGLEEVPIFFMGKVNNKEEIIRMAKEFIQTKKPLLGGKQIEGVVIKAGDYHRSTKIVHKDFSEALNGKVGFDKAKKGKIRTVEDLADYITERYITKGRVMKAVNLLEAEKGKIDLKDTGDVIKTVFTDVLEEEEKEIRSMLDKILTKALSKYSSKIVKLFRELLLESDRDG